MPETIKPVSPVSPVWGIVGPDEEIVHPRLPKTDEEAWRSFGVFFPDARAEADALGYRAVKLKVEVVE